jgi:maleylacetoacetate isomerase
MMKLYGYWRSLATCRVRIALALKNLSAEEVSIDLMQGVQHGELYGSINPQAVVPSLIIDDGPPLFQSLAIIEYIDETHPEPPLLPADARSRARVRGLAQIIAADTHPLIVPRVRGYLENVLQVDEPGRNRWIEHWTMKGLQGVEAHLHKESEDGRFCHGNTPTIADICLASQVFGAQLFKFDTSSVPRVMQIFGECMKVPAFERSQPMKQPGAPVQAAH